jgi:3-hydroxybutyrate dehydrogenase
MIRMAGLVENKVALVTGAARGIGREIARTLAAEGARVVISDLDQEEARQAAETLRDEGFEAVAVGCDVGDEDQVRRTVEAALGAFGGLDILVNNAGLQHVAPIEEFPTATFERMLRGMVVGPFLGIKHAAPVMKARGWGRILTIASINGLVGFAGKSAYNAAKHGAIGLTKVAALELASHGITVNALCPGYVDTPLVRNQLHDLAAMRGVSESRVLEEVIYPLVPQRRLLEASEVADYAAFLCSDRARGVTGQAVVLDGGYTAQ